MSSVIDAFFILIVIVYGLIICTGKRFIVYMIIEEYFYTLAWSYRVTRRVDMGYKDIGVMLIMSVSAIAVIFIFSKGKYVVYNIKKDQMHKIVEEMLLENKYIYVKQEDAILLTEHYNRKIELERWGFHGTSIDLSELREVRMDRALVDKIKSKLSRLEKIYFQIDGLIVIVLVFLYVYF